jgi:hypothetical protein
MGQLEKFLDAYSRVAQDFYDRPRPKRAILYFRQVDPPTCAIESSHVAGTELPPVRARPWALLPVFIRNLECRTRICLRCCSEALLR